MIPHPRRLLHLLPENPRYFQYKGLPCVMFWGTHHWGWRAHPDAGQIRTSAAYANLVTFQATDYRYSTYRTLWDRVGHDAYWETIARSVQHAFEHDVIVHLYFFDGHYRIENGIYPSSSQFFLPEKLDEDLGAHGLPGRTRRQLHERILDAAARHLAKFPNLIYDPIFESTPLFKLFGRRIDAFCRWWMDELRRRCEQVHPGVLAPAGTMLRETHPADRHMEVLLGEHNSDGFFADPARLTARIYDYHVPLVRMALREPEAFTSRISGDDVRAKISIGHPLQHLMIEQIVHGVHTAEHYNATAEGNWVTQSDELQRWFLQARWYLENIRTWRNEPGFHGGDEITREKLPWYSAAPRPTLAAPPGYRHGVKLTSTHWEFAAVYKADSAAPPLQAEVWVDRSGVGRYRTDPGEGDRIAMTVHRSASPGTFHCTAQLPRNDAAEGALYTFRFAAPDWIPPAPGGLIPDNCPGISYTSWRLGVA